MNSLPLFPQLAIHSEAMPDEASSLAERPANVEALERVVPDEVRDAIRCFLLGVHLATGSDKNQVAAWSDRLVADLGHLDFSRSEAVASSQRTIELLERDFASLVIRPRSYQYLLRLWLWTMLAILVAYVLMGEQSAFSVCERYVPFELIKGLCGDTHGHFFGYIAFRYAAFGVLMGAALFGSLSSARTRFTDPDSDEGVLARPVMRVVVSLAIAYILALLVASGKLGFDLLGFKVDRDIIFTNNVRQQGFRDAGALFAIGISAAIATEVYLNRIVAAMRNTANSVLGGASDSART